MSVNDVPQARPPFIYLCSNFRFRYSFVSEMVSLRIA